MDLEDRVKKMLAEWIGGLRTESADPRLSHYAWVTLIAAIVKFVGEIEQHRNTDDVALALPIPDRAQWVITPAAVSLSGRAEAMLVLDEYRLSEADAPTPAEALALAWLAWRERRRV